MDIQKEISKLEIGLADIRTRHNEMMECVNNIEGKLENEEWGKEVLSTIHQLHQLLKDTHLTIATLENRKRKMTN